MNIHYIGSRYGSESGVVVVVRNRPGVFKPEQLIVNSLYQHIFSKPGGRVSAGQTWYARNL